jgi:hypothetical protein
LFGASPVHPAAAGIIASDNRIAAKTIVPVTLRIPAIIS